MRTETARETDRATQGEQATQTKLCDQKPEGGGEQKSDSSESTAQAAAETSVRRARTEL